MVDDDDGQIDGDYASPFAQSPSDQPWLRAGTPPWHMWGNSQNLTLTLASGFFSDQQQGQLIKVAYGRPETWRWLFSARLRSVVPTPAVGTDLVVQLAWELTVGIGRSFQQHPAFDVWNYLIPGGGPQSAGILWATQAIQPSSLGRFNSAGVIDPTPPPNIISELCAQDIQLNVRAALLLSGAAVGYPYVATLEVGAQFAPINHIRPDWFLDGPAEQRFPGAEVAGK
jgi:hypothetical protein